MQDRGATPSVALEELRCRRSLIFQRESFWQSLCNGYCEGTQAVGGGETLGESADEGSLLHPEHRTHGKTGDCHSHGSETLLEVTVEI